LCCLRFPSGYARLPPSAAQGSPQQTPSISEREFVDADLFAHDQLATGRNIRVLAVVDTFSRFSPALNPGFSYRGEDVVQTLETTCAVIGYPKAIRVDQGFEFIRRDRKLWPTPTA